MDGPRSASTGSPGGDPVPDGDPVAARAQAGSPVPSPPSGPPVSAAEQKAASAEHHVAAVRLAVILFNVASYWFLLYPLGHPALAAVVCAIAVPYAFYVLLARPYLHWPVLRTSAWTAVTDGGLIVLWLHATGGMDSPFYPLWYLSLVAVTFRFDARGTVAATGAYIVLYVGLAVVAGQATVRSVDLLVRCAYIALVGTLGSILANESQRLFQDRFRLGRQVEEGERFRALAEMSMQGLLILQEGIIVEANRAFAGLVGRPLKELIGTTATALLAPEDRPEADAAVARGGSQTRDAWITRPDGTRRLLRSVSRASEWQGRPALVVAVHDATEEQAEAEEREQRMRHELEVQRLREMDRFRSDFLNAAAHELNTPLTPLRVQLHLLRKSDAQRPESERRALDVLGRNVDRLGRLVDEMLDVVRLESGALQLDPHPTDMCALARETVETFSAVALEAGVSLSFDGPPALQADFDAPRMGQVMYNLVSNAIKFTPAGGSVRVEVARQGEEAVVAVTDTGLGLTQEQGARLFQPFAQHHQGLVTARGTGLGLYITRGLVERHGGTVTCQSDGPGRGARFEVRLPLSARSPNTS